MSTIFPSPTSKDEKELVNEVKKALTLLNADIPHQLPDKIIIGANTPNSSYRMRL